MYRTMCAVGHDRQTGLWCCVRNHRYTKSLEPFYDSFDPQFLDVRRVVREVLQKEADLQEIVQLVGKARAGPGPSTLA